MTAHDLALFAPFIAAILLAAAILVVDFIWPGRFVPAILVTFMGLTLVGALIARRRAQQPGEAFGGAYVVDDLTTYLDLLFISIVALTVRSPRTTSRSATCRSPSSRPCSCSRCRARC